MQYLLRTEALLGKENIQKLNNAFVVVCGLGGVGGLCVETLARSGINHFRLIDADNFEETNLNRQNLCLVTNIGQKKTEIAKQRILDINPDAIVEIMTVFADSSNMDKVLSDNPTLVVDAIDSLSSKCLLLETCIKNNIKVVSSMGAALKTDPLKITTGDIKDTYVCPLAKQVRLNLKKENIEKGFKCVFSTEKSKKLENTSTLGSYAPVTGIFALILADLAIKEMINN